MSEFIIIKDNLKIFCRRRPVKNIYLKVNSEGQIFLSVPVWTSEKVINNFLEDKKIWLQKALQKNLQQKCFEESLLNSTNKALIWGELYNIIFKVGHNQALKFNGNDLLIFTRKEITPAMQKKYLEKIYKELLSSKLKELFTVWQKKMHLYAGDIRIRTMKTRWGSCNVKTGNITINSKLIQYPEICLEYIVVHELAHLYEASHSKKFRDFVEYYLPDWQYRRKLLNDYLSTLNNENLL